MSISDFQHYAGQWVGLTESLQIVGFGPTTEEASQSARANRFRERIQIYWVSPEPPYILLPEWPIETIRDLRLLSERTVWIVGGTVRDLIMVRPPHDWDFAVQGDALDLARCVADRLRGAFYPLDEARGIGRVVFPKQASAAARVTLDFAATRGDGSIESDLHTRDFTINAMALTLTGQLIDPMDGLKDLRQGILRETNPDVYREDPVRLLRAVRLAHTLGHRLSPVSRAAILDQSELLATVAPERICAEMQAIVSHPQSAASMRMLSQLGLLRHVLPELAALASTTSTEAPDQHEAWELTLATLTGLSILLSTLRAPIQTPSNDRCPNTQVTQILRRYQRALLTYLSQQVTAGMSREHLLGWSALFSEQIVRGIAGQAEAKGDRTRLVTEQLQRLRLPKRAINHVAATLVAFGDLVDSPAGEVDARQAHRFFRDAGEAGTAALLLALARCCHLGVSGTVPTCLGSILSQVNRLLYATFLRHDTVIHPIPLLSGNDLLELGVPEGPLVGSLLRQLSEEQAASVINDREAAKAWVRAYLHMGE